MKWLDRLIRAVEHPLYSTVVLALYTYCFITYAILEEATRMNQAMMVFWGLLVIERLWMIRKRRQNKIEDAIRRLGGEPEEELLPGEIPQPRPSQTRK